MGNLMKKGNRANKIKLYRQAEKDLKNMDSIQQNMKQVSEFVVSIFYGQKRTHIPNKEEISDIILIAVESLEVKLDKKYQDLCVTPIIENLKIIGLKSE